MNWHRLCAELHAATDFFFITAALKLHNNSDILCGFDTHNVV